MKHYSCEMGILVERGDRGEKFFTSMWGFFEITQYNADAHNARTLTHTPMNTFEDWASKYEIRLVLESLLTTRLQALSF
jgi:hypothetical protein